jgi:hypothetical protein
MYFIYIVVLFLAACCNNFLTCTYFQPFSSQKLIFDSLSGYSKIL